MTLAPFKAYVAIVRPPYAVVICPHPADPSTRLAAGEARSRGAAHVLLMPAGTNLAGCERAIAKAAGHDAAEQARAAGRPAAAVERAQLEAETRWAVALTEDRP